MSNNQIVRHMGTTKFTIESYIGLKRKSHVYILEF